jgi:hypothetical protein
MYIRGESESGKAGRMKGQGKTSKGLGAYAMGHTGEGIVSRMIANSAALLVIVERFVCWLVRVEMMLGAIPVLRSPRFIFRG